MNRAGPGTFSGDIKECLREDVRSLLQDTTTTTVITVSTPTQAGTFTPASGAYANTVSECSVRAWVTDLTLNQVLGIPGAQIGDLKVFVMDDDLQVPPNKDTSLNWGGDDYSVLEVRTDVINVHHELHARRRS